MLQCGCAYLTQRATIEVELSEGRCIGKRLTGFILRVWKLG